MPYSYHQAIHHLFVLFIALTISVSSLQRVQADYQHPIDVWLEQQMEQDYSTAGMCSALAEGAERWDKELNLVYGRLMKSLSPSQIESLKTAQRAWITFRDAELSAIGSIVSMKEGTMYRVEAANLYYELIKQRTLQLLSYED